LQYVFFIVLFYVIAKNGISCDLNAPCCPRNLDLSAGHMLSHVSSNCLLNPQLHAFPEGNCSSHWTKSGIHCEHHFSHDFQAKIKQKLSEIKVSTPTEQQRPYTCSVLVHVGPANKMASVLPSAAHLPSLLPSP